MITPDNLLTPVTINGKITVLARNIEQLMMPVFRNIWSPTYLRVSVTDEDGDELIVDRAVMNCTFDPENKTITHTAITGTIMPRGML